MRSKVLKLTLVSIALLAFVGIGQNDAYELPSELKNPGSEKFSFCTIKNESFEAGEELVYRIFYHWGPINLAAGEVVFKVEDNGDNYRIIADGKTLQAFQWFYTVSDYFESHVDKESLLPELFIRDVEEGKYKEYNKFVFDQEANKVVSYGGKTKDDLKKEELDIGACMHDMLSIMYVVRNLNFESLNTGDAFPVEIFVEEEYPLTVRYLGKNRKRIRGLGKFNTYQFSPEVIAGHVFKEKDQMHVWVTEDKNKLPVMIESPISVGKIRAFLKDYKGLRHEMTAKVN